MSDDHNRVELDSGKDFDYSSTEVDFSEAPRSKAGKFAYVFMFSIIIVLIFVSFKFYKESQLYKKLHQEKKNALRVLEEERTKKLYGDLHLEVEDPEKGLPKEKKTSPAGVEIYLNGELQKAGSGVRLTNQDIRTDLVFEFKKPGYYPTKLHIGSCNWKKIGKDKYVYENRDIRLAIDENGMMALEEAKKERKKEEKLRRKKKKRRRW